MGLCKRFAVCGSRFAEERIPRTVNPALPAGRREPLTVLYVIWSLGLGGAERVVINLALGLDKRRFKPLVCCLNDKGAFAEELEKAGIEVMPLHKKGKWDIRVVGKLAGIIRRRKIDIVHTHLWGANLWGRLAALLCRASVIIATEHNEDVWKPRVFLLADRLLACGTDKIVAVSRSVRDFYVQQAGIRAEKIQVVYNGVTVCGKANTVNPALPAGRRTPLTEEIGLLPDDTVLAIIGRLVEQKGHRYLFDALRQMDDKYKIKLLVVGDGPLLGSLRSTVGAGLASARIIFLGLRKDVREILEITDILVMPSTREGLSIVALEAMAQGVPIIASMVGGNPELIINGETGLLVRPRDAQELKKALIELLENKDLRARMGANARLRVEEKFSLRVMIETTERLYVSLWERKERMTK
ncbi:MAG: glycosyltransferase [Candidatus Omnitrophota bacterium]